MTRNFDLDDFEKVFSDTSGSKRKELTKKLYAEWKEQWKEYIKSVKNEGEKGSGKLRRIERRKKDPYGFETKKFLKWILGDERGVFDVDALILIFITARMRNALRVHQDKYGKDRAHRKRMGLWWLIDEWEDQENLLKHFDSFTAALIDCEYNPMHIAWAIIGHARRMRIGADRKDSVVIAEEKVRISERLLNLAEFHLEGVVEDKNEIAQFCSFPPSVDVFKIYLNGQRMQNKARKGVQKEAVELARKQRGDMRKLDEKKKNSKSKFEWEKFLEWWTWYVEIRAASSSMNISKFREAGEKLKELENTMKAPLDSYFKISQRERFKLQIDTDIVRTDPLRLVLFEIVRRWRDFHALDDYLEPTTTRYMRFCRSDKNVARTVLGFPEMHEKILGPIWNNTRKEFQDTRTTAYKHPSAPFQKFVFSSSKPRPKRAEVMLNEIEMVRSLSLQFAGNLSCLVMEILYRELLYRLWYEIHKMHLNIDHEVDVEFAIRILKRIKGDIVRLRVYGDEEHPEIDKTVEILRGDGKILAGDYAKKLRHHINSDFETTTNPRKGEQCYFLGIPYAHHGDDFSEIMHSFSHILEKTDDQVLA